MKAKKTKVVEKIKPEDEYVWVTINGNSWTLDYEWNFPGIGRAHLRSLFKELMGIP